VATRLPAEQRRRQLLDVACEVFAERGFHATSMDDVATAAGVTKPVLYQHFASKRGLFLEVLDDVGHRLLSELAVATSSAHTGRQRVEAGFAAYFRFVTEHEAAFRVLFGASARNDAGFAAVIAGVLDQIAEVISPLIEVEAGPRHRRVLAHALIGIAEATSRDAITEAGPGLDAVVLAGWVSELAWSGLRGITTGPRQRHTLPTNEPSPT
jgi:AcrR family transcriptional regulator